MARIKANMVTVTVYPKDLRAIPDILPYNKLIQGDPVTMDLTKKEIQRCMNFGDVFDVTSGEEVLIDELSFRKIEEFVKEEDTEDEGSNDEGEEPPSEPDTPSRPSEDEEEILEENLQTVENSKKGALSGGVEKTIVK